MSQNNVNQLLNAAKDDGIISGKAIQALNIPDMGAQIQAGLGIDVDDVPASETTLVAMLIDDSPSINGIPNGPQAVCTGQNMMIDSLVNSKQKDSILTGTWLLNDDNPVQPFIDVENSIRLKENDNYYTRGCTPLYRKANLVLGTTVAKMQEFADNGVACRAVVVIVTDGYDEDYSNTGRTVQASDCNIVIKELQENVIVLFMGINGSRVDFNGIADEMGIPSQNVYTPDNTESEIRKAFGMASRSAIRASQNALGFSQAAIGGFGS